ncbi:hypothetical protein MNBD_GAMMA16-1907 [hydrothermal vent metagenome]|uniref:Uncharacterized protein n=1 Tax=hydrothermal vent metagenome TaxID=652676 RepID=A0A3B0ZVI6_9ZZZZ
MQPIEYENNTGLEQKVSTLILSNYPACLYFVSDQGVFARKEGAYRNMQPIEYENNTGLEQKMDTLGSYIIF